MNISKIKKNISNINLMNIGLADWYLTIAWLACWFPTFATFAAVLFAGFILSPTAKAHTSLMLEKALGSRVLETYHCEGVKVKVVHNGVLSGFGGACADPLQVWIEERLANNLGVLHHEISHVKNNDARKSFLYQLVGLVTIVIGLVTGSMLLALASQLTMIVIRTALIRLLEIRADYDSVTKSKGTKILDIVRNSPVPNKFVAWTQHPYLPRDMRIAYCENLLVKISK